MSTAKAWFPYRTGASGFELFAFPHAGAGSTVFSFLREALSHSGIALAPAVLPGRERRLREATHGDMDTLLADFEDMAQRDGYSAFMGDYALLGHCSGALVAYEIIRLLERSPCQNPQLLVVCSCLPPPLIRDTGISRLPTEELFLQTASMGGTPGALMANRDFLEILERPLRADWVLLDGYLHRALPKLETPILAIRGVEDPDVQASDLQLWRNQTVGSFSTRDLDFGHWALTEAGSSALAREIPAALYATRDA